VIDVNVVGVFLGLKHVLPVMLKQNSGSIVDTASIAGLIGSPDVAVYSASKHAVIGPTKSAALESAGTGVRVNCVCPGLIDSRMLSAIIEDATPATRPSQMPRSWSGFLPADLVRPRKLPLAWPSWLPTMLAMSRVQPTLSMADLSQARTCTAIAAWPGELSCARRCRRSPRRWRGVR